MESFSQRDNVLLGYSSRKSFTSSSNKSVDIDFHDVFGGPPRRSSVHDWRSSLGSNEDEMVLSRDPWSGLTEKPVFGQESNTRKYPSDDFYGDIFRGDESSGSTPRKLSRDPISSSPASRISSPSRSLPIQSESIRGSSLSLPPMLSLPGKLGKEMDSIASPIQSRNARKNKETALIGFPSSPGASTSRFSIQVSQGKEGLEIDSRSSYRQSSLSKEVSLISKGSDEALKFVKHESVAYAKEDSHTSEISYSSTEFHFSIYRWPSTTVPIVAPLRGGKLSCSKESGKTDSIINEEAASNLPSVVLPSENYTTSVKDESVQGSQENEDDDSVLSTKSDLTDPPEIVAEVISTKRGRKPRSNFQNIFKKVQDNLMSQNAGNDVKTSTGATGSDSGSFGGFLDKMKSVSKREAHTSDEPLYCLLTEDKIGTGNRSIKGTEKRSPISKNVLPSPEEPLYCMLKEIKDDAGASGADKDLLGRSGRRTPISKKEAPNEGEPLYRLLKEDYKRQENHNDTDKVTTKKGTVKSIHTSDSDVGKDKRVKKQPGRRNILNLSKATSPSLEETSVSVEDKPVNNKVKGMVKDFVKIFNQEASSKSVEDVETRVQGNTATDIGAGEVEDQTSVGATKTDQKNNRTLTDNPVKVDQSLKQSAKPQREIKTADQILFQVDQSSKQFAKPKREIKTADQVFEFASERKSSSVPRTETGHGSFATAFGNVEESCEDLDCTVKELSQDQNNQPQAGQDHEVLQASDAKIRKWSNGKEGNIRSLLSTLQYVLWPESGWKPVPLVDIIEGSSVRRAYQRALLCLHPDKLQQKGAAPHQKYIAEKVFDVLQEAWTQFNSLGSF